MTRNNAIKQKKKSKSNAMRKNRQGMGLLTTPMTQLRFSPSNPGRVLVRGALEVFNGDTARFLSYLDFNTWFPQARNLLTAFEYFRVSEANITVRVAGGTSSAHSVVFNVSNSPSSSADTGAVAVLNDDYAAIASAALSPSLHPPRAYWTQGARQWYRAVDPTAAVPVAEDRIPGSVSYSASGGASGTIVVAWLVVELELEFHTLV